MTRRFARFVVYAGLIMLFVGCASKGPVVIKPPTVSVSEFRSVSFTPSVMDFEAKLFITNNMSAGLDFQKVDFAMDLYDQQIFEDSFSGLKHTNEGGNQTVTFPSLRIDMAALAAQAPSLLAEGSLRVTFRGEVFTAAQYGFDPIPFSQTLTIPIPRLPDVTYAGFEGEPFSDSFRLRFQVTNTNTFPFTVTSVKTFLVINGQRYSLLHTRQSVEVPPGETQPVVLRMENSPGKTLSMALSLLDNSHPRFDITGSVTFNTPYGWIFIPMNFTETLR